MLWGWIMTYSYAVYHINYSFQVNFWLQGLLRTTGLLLPFLGLAITLFFIYGRTPHFKQKNGFLILTIWVCTLLSMMLINLVQFNVLKEVNFVLQHPIFMTLTAFSITITGAVLKYPYLIIGGLVFGVLAFTASSYKLEDQLLIEAVAWLLAVAIPGHLRSFRLS